MARGGDIGTAQPAALVGEHSRDLQADWPAGPKEAGGYRAGEEKLELLKTGPDSFERLKQLIEDAEETLRLYYYTFASDQCGRQILDRLVDAQNRGVEVHLIVDDFGSLETNDDFFQPLRDAGGHFCEFQPNLAQAYLLRNHQKIAIADAVRGIVGSFNIADPHLTGDGADAWRDIGVYIEGPAMTRLAIYYDRLEAWTSAPDRSHIRDLGELLDDANETEGTVRWVFGGPARKESAYVEQVMSVLRDPGNVDMIMAYFAPSRRVLAAVRRKARTDRLRVIAARKTDVRLSRAAAWHTYRKLIRAGAEIYEYLPRLLHSKLIVTDDVVFIGSGNFDVRSLYINLELMLRVERPDFHDQVCDLFCEEMQESERVDMKALKAKAGPVSRFFWRASYWAMTAVDRYFSRHFAR